MVMRKRGIKREEVVHGKALNFLQEEEIENFLIVRLPDRAR